MIYSSVERLEAVHKRTLLKQRFKGNTKLNDQEVKERTDATVKMANVTQESASTVSEWMTSIWNNFDDGSKKLDYYADVLTKLGASTASSSEEIAEGVRKFAGISNTVGLSYEYAASALATITATTRESADVVGTALRTLFSRFQGLKLGKTLEDGTTLNKYSDALKTAGIDIKTQSGALKDMDTILDELIEKWKTLNKDQEMALAQTMGGQRQYAHLVTLLDQGDFFKQNLQTAYGSTGELDKQQKIYEESWQGAQDRLTASFEGLVKTVENDNFFIALTDGASSFLDSLSAVIEGMGGLKVIVPVVGGLLLNAFGPQLNNAILNIKDSFNLTKTGIQGIYDSYQKQIKESYSVGFGSNQVSKMDEFRYRSSIDLLEVKKRYGEIQDKLTQAEKMGAQSYIEGLETQIALVQKLIQKEQELTQTLEQQKEKSVQKAYSLEDNIYNDDYSRSLERRAKNEQNFGRRQELLNDLDVYRSGAGAIQQPGIAEYLDTEKLINTAAMGGDINAELKNIDAQGLSNNFIKGTTDLLYGTRNQNVQAEGFVQQASNIIAAIDALPQASDKLNQVKEQLEENMQGVRDAFATGDNIDQSITNLEASLRKLAQDSITGQVTAEFKELFSSMDSIRILAPKQADAIEAAAKAYQDQQAAILKTNQAIASYQNSLKQVGQVMNHISSPIEMLGSLTSVISGLSSAFMGVTSIVRSLGNESLSTSEKITSMLMGVTMVLPMINSGARTVLDSINLFKAGSASILGVGNVISEIMNNASVGVTAFANAADNAARSQVLITAGLQDQSVIQTIINAKEGERDTLIQKEILKQGLINAGLTAQNAENSAILILQGKQTNEVEKQLIIETLKKTGLSEEAALKFVNLKTEKDITKELIKQTAIKFIKSPLAIGIATVAATIAVIYGTYKAIQYIRNDDARDVEEKAESLQQTQQLLEKAKTTQQEFTDNFSKYKEGLEALESLKEGTEDYRKKLQETNDATLRLISSHKELAKNSWVDDEGVIRLDETYAKNAQKQIDSQVRNLQLQEYRDQNALDRAETKKRMSDLADTKQSDYNTGSYIGGIVTGLVGAILAPVTAGMSLALIPLAGAITIAEQAIIEQMSDNQTEAMQYLADAYNNEGADVLKNKKDYLEEAGFDEDILNGIDDNQINSLITEIANANAELKILNRTAADDKYKGQAWYDNLNDNEKNKVGELDNQYTEKYKQERRNYYYNADELEARKAYAKYLESLGYTNISFDESSGSDWLTQNIKGTNEKGETVDLSIGNFDLLVEAIVKQEAASSEGQQIIQDNVKKDATDKNFNQKNAQTDNTGNYITISDAASQSKTVESGYYKHTSEFINYAPGAAEKKGLDKENFEYMSLGTTGSKWYDYDKNKGVLTVFTQSSGTSGVTKEQYSLTADVKSTGKTLEDYANTGDIESFIQDVSMDDQYSSTDGTKTKNKKKEKQIKRGTEVQQKIQGVIGGNNTNYLQDLSLTTGEAIIKNLNSNQISYLNNLLATNPAQKEGIIKAIDSTDWTKSGAGSLFMNNLESFGVKLGKATDGVELFADQINRSKIDETTLANNAKVGSSEYQNLVAGDTVTAEQKAVLSGSSLGGKIEQYLIQNADGSYTLLAEGEKLIKSEGLSLPTSSSQQISAMESIGDVLNATSEQQSTEEYSTKLITIASQYKSCSKELSEYSKAVKQYGVNSSQAEIAQKALTKALKAAAWEENAEEISKNIDTLKNEESSAEDLATAYGNIAKQINEALGTNFTSEFIEEHADDIIKLQGASAEQVQQIIEGLLNDKFDEAKENEIAKIQAEIDITDDDEVKAKLQKIKAALEGLPSRTELKIEAQSGNMGPAFQQVQTYFDRMRTEGKTIDEINRKLKEIFGTEFELKYEYDTVTNVLQSELGLNDQEASLLPGAQSQGQMKKILKKITFKETGGGNSLGGVPNGSGGGSKKENKEKDPADKYKSLSNLIDKLKDDLSELAALQDRVWGSDRLQNMDAQISAIQGIISKYEEYQALVKPDVDSQKNQLINDWGAVIDENTGTILNYEQVKNKIIDQYNNSAKKEADEKAYDTAIKLLEAYQENANTVNENSKAIKDYKRQIEDLKDAQIEYIQEVAEKVYDLKDAQIDLSRSLLEASREVFGNANLYMSQTFDEFAQGFTKLDMANAKIADYEKRLREATDSTNIKDLQDKLLDARKEASVAYKEIISLGQKFTDQLKDSFDAIIERYKKISDNIDFSSNIGEAVKSMAQLSRLGTKYYTIANKVSELEIGNALSRKKVAQDQFNELQEKIKEADLAISKAATEFDRKEAQVRKDMYVQQAQEAQLEIINSGKDALEAAQNQYEEQIEGALKAFEEAATKGAGFDFMKQLFDNFVSNEEEYLDPVNKKFDLETLNRKIQTEINKSDSKYRTNLLKSLQKENDLRAKNYKLSEYDLEIMNKKYDITMKQIALEEARNSKTNMQLVRTAAGNWSYIFTNDEDNVSSAEQALSDSQKEYWNTAKKQVLDIASRRVDLENELMSKFSSIAENADLSTSQKDKQYKETYNWYLDQIGILREKFNIATADLEDAGDLANVDYADDFTQNLLETLPEKLSENAAKTLYNNIRDIEEESGNRIESIKQTVEANISDMNFNLSEAKKHTESSMEDLDKISAAWDDYDSTLNDIVKPALRTMSQCLQNIEQVLVNGELLAYQENVDYAELIRNKINSNSNYYGSAEYEKDLRARDAKLGMMSRTGELTESMIDQTTDYTALARAYKQAFGADNTYQQILAEADFKGAVAQWLNIDPKGSWTSTNSNDILNKLREVGIVQYDTGGYTGDFDNGRLAILHEKELVLNKDDTSNLLNTVDIINKLDKEVVAGLALMLQKASGGRFLDNLDTRKIEQDVKIEAHFPNVTSAEEIELSLNNLVNEAAQRAGTY